VCVFEVDNLKISQKRKIISSHFFVKELNEVSFLFGAFSKIRIISACFFLSTTKDI